MKEENYNQPFVFHMTLEGKAKWEMAKKEYFRLREKVLVPVRIPAAGSADEGLIHVLRRASDLRGIHMVGVYGKPMVVEHIEMAKKIERYCRSSTSLHLCPPVIKALEIDEVKDLIATLNHHETAYERNQKLAEVEKARQMVKHRETCEKGRKRRKRR